MRGKPYKGADAARMRENGRHTLQAWSAMKPLFFAIALLVSSAACAQTAHKCRLANGQISYSDKPCAAHHAGGRISLRQNSLDTSQGYWQDVQLSEQRRSAAAAPEPLTAPNPAQADRRNSWACRNAMRNLQVANSSLAGEWDDAARQEAARACGQDPYGGAHLPSREEVRQAERLAARRRNENDMPLPEPAAIGKCNRDGCWDSGGQWYNRTNNGRSYFGPNGQACSLSGGVMRCH